MEILFGGLRKYGSQATQIREAAQVLRNRSVFVLLPLFIDGSPVFCCEALLTANTWPAERIWVDILWYFSIGGRKRFPAGGAVPRRFPALFAVADIV